MITREQERHIVSGILNGNERALYRFYSHYFPKLLLFIKRKVGVREDAEEILQDSLLAAIERLRDFTFRSRLSTFLYAISKNKIVDYYRKKKIKKILFSQSPQLESILTTLFGPEEVFDKKQEQIKLDTAFKSLSPDYRKIISLKYLEGKSVWEITKVLKVSFKSAESRLFRARRAFAKALQIV